MQVAISSVIKDSNRNQQTMLSGTSDYGAKLADLEPTFSPETRDVRQRVLTNEKPFIEHFEYAHHSGFAMLSVTEDDVTAEIHNGTDSGKPWKTVSLTKLLS